MEKFFGVRFARSKVVHLVESEQVIAVIDRLVTNSDSEYEVLKVCRSAFDKNIVSVIKLADNFTGFKKKLKFDAEFIFRYIDEKIKSVEFFRQFGEQNFSRLGKRSHVVNQKFRANCSRSVTLIKLVCLSLTSILKRMRFSGSESFNTLRRKESQKGCISPFSYPRSFH